MLLPFFLAFFFLSILTLLSDVKLVRIGAYTNIQDGTVITEAFGPLNDVHDGSTIIGNLLFLFFLLLLVLLSLTLFKQSLYILWYHSCRFLLFSSSSYLSSSLFVVLVFLQLLHTFLLLLFRSSHDLLRALLP